MLDRRRFAHLAATAALAAAMIDPDLRPEVLEVEDFVRLLGSVPTVIPRPDTT